MNKTLLIIICDFLLISILALVEFKPSIEEQLVDAQGDNILLEIFAFPKCAVL